ncbi:uncharacterized protein EI90DRAFT_459420 [Cantharellus anzutake]|uniref:uncharacterized protein n=1 Tax=Cantharellus anzutake TaxID=1750568 RepID=UPI001906264B|nr:uncharacterized protein EI90DRAFT_459420 [Cantharellus anzutake]KAF8334739.1 hypothetical protein EI90DRAFT_459420 [Cantharellus anzutake]
MALQPCLYDDSATASDDDQTSSSTTSSRSSSKGKSTKPPTSTSSITSAALPEQWFCERCVPRPVDASAARARQTRRLQADRERLFRAAGIVEQIPNGRKKSRPENIDKRRRSTVTGTQQITTESVRRSKSGTSSRKPTSNRNRSSSVDISPLDEDTMFEPWANEFVRINQDVIADEGVRQAIRHWRSSIEGNTRDSPTSSSRSQPPMPISPVTECSPLPPLPSIKVPPVRLLVKQVPPSECQPIPTPTIASLPPPNATPSYHDNTLHNSDPKSLSYGRPPTYGVYTSNSTSGTIPAGTLLATFVSRIIPVSAYTCAPLSQYALLQLPKPHVRLIPPPLSLALDAREMGNESRFIRNGCHPNAVIRPVISESSPAGVEWGVYSMRSISAKGEEIVLGWEWDANSPVQLLNDVLENGCADVQDETNLKAEMCQILCTLGGTFTSCACGSGQKLSGSNKCVFTLMSQFICDRSQFTATTPFPLRMHAPSSPESLDGTSVKKEKPYLGPMLASPFRLPQSGVRYLLVPLLTHPHPLQDLPL